MYISNLDNQKVSFVVAFLFASRNSCVMNLHCANLGHHSITSYESSTALFTVTVTICQVVAFTVVECELCISNGALYR